MRIVLADDHAPTRAVVRAALEKDGCVVTADVADAPAAVAAALSGAPDVCLLDLNMPGSGITAAAQITNAVPGARVVMLSASRDDHELYAAVRAGAVGYLLKDTDPDRLGSALRAVLSGEKVLPRALLLRALDDLRPTSRRWRLRGRAVAPAATEREVQVLELLATGASAPEVGDQLEIDVVVVRADLAQALSRLRGVARSGHPCSPSL